MNGRFAWLSGAAHTARKFAFRPVEATPEPLWDIRDRRILHQAIKRGDLVAVAVTEARLDRV